MWRLREDPKYRGSVAVIAVNLDEDPETVYEYLVQADMNMDTLLDGSRIAELYGVRSTPTVYLIDGNGVVRLRVGGYASDTMKRLTQKLDFITGQALPEYGWRKDFAIAYSEALEQLGRGELDAALNAFKSIAPRKPITVFIDFSTLPSNAPRGYRDAVGYAANVWTKSFPRNILQFKLVDKREDADIFIKFAPQVYNPRDETGTLTDCAQCAPLEGRRTVGTIALGHASTGVIHAPEAIVHLAGGIIGFALGLDRRDEEGSIMQFKGDIEEGAPLPAFVPSPDDLLILANFLATVHYHLADIYIRKKMPKEAKEALDVVTALFPRHPKAPELRKRLREVEASQGAGKQ